MNPSFSSLLRTGLALLCAVVAGTNALADYVVNSTGDAGWDGNPHRICETGFANGVCTLRAAIQASNAVGGGTISFNIPTSDPGYSNGVWTIILNNGAFPDITAAVSISGPGAASLVVNGYANPSRIFNVTTTGTVNFSGLDIAYGAAPLDENGGGIQNVNAGTVNVTNCTLTSNLSGTRDAMGGGGIANSSNGTVNVASCAFNFNQAAGDASARAYLGGAIYNNTGILNVSNSTFAHNAADRGGGVFNESGIVTISNSTFHANGATIDGGGISSAGGTSNVTNSTFYANVAFGTTSGGLGAPHGVGGGVSKLFSAGTLNLTNSTIAANFAEGTGGGLYADTNSVVNIKSCIIASNYGGMLPNTVEAPDVFGAFTSKGFNLIGKKDGSTGFTAATDKKGTVASPLNPKLDPKGLRSNGGPTQTVALVSGSPAIDKGTSAGLTGALTTEQRGFVRTVDNSGIANATGGDGTDIGAYEFNAH